jgi:hypothetical protein
VCRSLDDLCICVSATRKVYGSKTWSIGKHDVPIHVLNFPGDIRTGCCGKVFVLGRRWTARRATSTQGERASQRKNNPVHGL